MIQVAKKRRDMLSVGTDDVAADRPAEEECLKIKIFHIQVIVIVFVCVYVMS